MYKKYCFILLLTFVWIMPLQARPWKYFSIYRHSRLTRFSFEIESGTSLYSGNYAGFLNFSAQKYGLNPTISMQTGIRITPYLSLRAGAGWLSLNAKNLFINPVSFHTSAAKYSVCLVHDLFPKSDFDARHRKFNFYGLAGLQYMVFSVKQQDAEKNTVSKTNYNSLAPYFGAGLQYYFYENFSIGSDLSYALPLTNMLDGQGFGPNDHFITLNIRAVWHIWHQNNGYRYKNYLRSGQ